MAAALKVLAFNCTLKSARAKEKSSTQVLLEQLMDALKEHGAVYLNAIGGAAQFYARSIDKALGVHLLDFGIPEAMWHLHVHDFAAIVTMDAHGNSLHKDIEQESGAHLAIIGG